MVVPQSSPADGGGEGRSNRLARAVVFAGAARRYWLTVFPRVCLERRRRRARAARIPDARLRAAAIAAAGVKWGNVEGAAAFAAFVPRSRRAAAARAMMSFQAAYNYLDLLSEQPSPDPAANGRALHGALLAALDPGAGPDGVRGVGEGTRAGPGQDGAEPGTRSGPADWYAHCPQRHDGGYLAELVGECRAALARLPSYATVAPTALAAAGRIVEFQSCNTGERSGALAALERWARAADPTGEEDGAEQARWWEIAAAGGSSLLVFALIALAGRPRVDPSAPAALTGAYWPWIGALHSLLDNLIDVEEDRATAQHSLVSLYPSPSEAARRMGELARRALAGARALPDPEPHVLVLGAMASFYLSAPEARTPAARPVADAVLGPLQSVARPALATLRLRRALVRRADAQEVDSPAVTPAEAARPEGPRRVPA